MSLNDAERKSGARPGRGLAMPVGVFLVQPVLSAKRCSNQGPAEAAGSYSESKNTGVVWSTEAEMSINCARGAAKGPKTSPKCTYNCIGMSFNDAKHKPCARRVRRLAEPVGVFLVQPELSAKRCSKQGPPAGAGSQSVTKITGVVWITEGKISLDFAMGAAKVLETPPKST